MNNIVARLKDVDTLELKRMADEAEARLERLKEKCWDVRLKALDAWVGTLSHKVEKQHHSIMGLNVCIGDLNEQVFGDRRGYGKDGSGPGWSPEVNNEH